MSERDDDLTPNDEQRRLIQNTEGTYLVDAGPGTGKTFTVTRRYANIVDQQGVDPEDVLLVTFTRSAATEMKERIVDHADYGMRELADAPIQTFHSHCHDVLREYGYDAPTHLGIDERITGSTRVIEDDLIEANLFAEFVDGFRDDHPAYDDQFRALSDPTELLGLITELASKGVFPTDDGWYRDGEAALDGDFEAFEARFDAVNEPRNDGRKQSELRAALSRFGDSKTYLPDAPSKTELRGGRGTKRLDASVAHEVFDEDRERLKAFVHDVYFEYLRFALRRNYLTFGFLQLFAFVTLCEDPAVRERARFEYVMVDEFQDTSEIQFKLALLLAGTDNLCAVGDWKQSIYSFQYADVRNILEFETRLDRFTTELNSDGDRVAFTPGDIEKIPLRQNYRSTETIIDLSEDALRTPATGNDTVEDPPADIVELDANAAFDNSVTCGYQHDDDPEAVLSLIQDIVDSEAYAIEDEDGERRPPTHDDIAVFTRTRDYGRDLLEVAAEYDVPVAYDGGIELFRTDPAKLLLAWLRILDDGADRGWAVVLERAGYALDEIDHVLDAASYPEEMVAFRDRLAALESVGAVARQVFDRYGLDGDVAEVLLHTVQATHDATTLTRGELIRYIERGIDQGSIHDVHTSTDEDSVTVQTIHSAKGLEYPIVILVNMNDGRFPPRTRNTDVVTYRDPVGLRQRKLYADVGEHPHVYDNWRHDVIRRCLPREYDEERRLLYVAITRAEQHALFVGGEEPNTFLEALPVDVEPHEPSIERGSGEAPAQTDLPFAVRTPDGPIGHTPHSLMDETVFDDAGEQMEAGVDEGETETRGVDFGSRVHEFAEAYALGDDVSPSNDDERHVAAFLDGLDGRFHVEEPVRLPLDVDGDRVTISGIADLVHETADAVEIVDYKTDSGRYAEPEYRKQLSVYHHVLSEWFSDRDVRAGIFYTRQGEYVGIDPLSRAELASLVRAQGDESG